MLINTPDPTDITARPAFYRLCVRTVSIKETDCGHNAATNVKWAERIIRTRSALKTKMHPNTLQPE